MLNLQIINKVTFYIIVYGYYFIVMFFFALFGTGRISLTITNKETDEPKELTNLQYFFMCFIYSILWPYTYYMLNKGGEE